MKYSVFIDKALPLINPVFIPALIFCLGLFGFYLYGNFSNSANLTYHSLFFLVGFLTFMILLYYNQSKPSFIILCLGVSYILVNILKNQYPENYTSQAAYQNLTLMLPLNLLFFYFWPPQKLLKRINVFLLLGLFIEYAILEHISRYGINLNVGSDSSSLSAVSLIIFGLAIMIIFADLALRGGVLNYALFFVFLSVWLGIYHSASASALAILFCTAQLIMLVAVIQNIYLETYRDPLTGLPGRNAYILHTKDFPLKYCIGIISIDDFDKLNFRFGKLRQNQLIKLMVTKILEYEKEDCLYRYNTDEFVIIFKNMDKNESFEQLENIRRAVASAYFLLNPRRPALKLTVSAGVSEKKRSDANSFEVLLRARKVLEKTRSFSHNVTSKA